MVMSWTKYMSPMDQPGYSKKALSHTIFTYFDTLVLNLKTKNKKQKQNKKQNKKKHAKIFSIIEMDPILHIKHLEDQIQVVKHVSENLHEIIIFTFITLQKSIILSAIQSPLSHTLTHYCCLTHTSFYPLLHYLEYNVPYLVIGRYECSQ